MANPTTGDTTKNTRETVVLLDQILVKVDATTTALGATGTLHVDNVDMTPAAQRPTVVITRNGDGTVNTLARTLGGVTVTRTYAYVGGLCTGWTEA
jgi:hypothetical protein